MTTEIPIHGPGSVRALIGELAQLEDAVRRARTATASPGDGPVFDPQLVQLLKREADVIAALRAQRTPDLHVGRT